MIREGMFVHSLGELSKSVLAIGGLGACLFVLP